MDSLTGGNGQPTSEHALSYEKKSLVMFNLIKGRILLTYLPRKRHGKAQGRTTCVMASLEAFVSVKAPVQTDRMIIGCRRYQSQHSI